MFKKIEKLIKIIAIGFVIYMGAYLYTKPEVTLRESRTFWHALLMLGALLFATYHDDK